VGQRAEGQHGLEAFPEQPVIFNDNSLLLRFHGGAFPVKINSIFEEFKYTSKNPKGLNLLLVQQAATGKPLQPVVHATTRKYRINPIYSFSPLRVGSGIEVIHLINTDFNHKEGVIRMNARQLDYFRKKLID
jgi:hypothetical protein